MSALREENERFRRGDFTKEEIHNFCHNLHGKVSAEEFAEGCRKEMHKLYGKCPWDENKYRLAEIEKRLRRVESYTEFPIGSTAPALRAPAAGEGEWKE